MTSESPTNLEGMTKVFEGRTDFPCTRIERLMTENPERLVLVIEKKEDGYYSTVYVKEKPEQK